MAYPNGKKTFAELSDPERWTWQTEVYAFRCVVLEQPIAPGSPVDPDGKYFDKKLVEYEVHRQRNKARPKPAPLLDRKPDDEVLRGRAIENEYARSRGFPDFDTAYDAGAIDFADVLNWINARHQMQRKASDYSPTGDEMAAARAALGMTDAVEIFPETQDKAHGLSA